MTNSTSSWGNKTFSETPFGWCILVSGLARGTGNARSIMRLIIRITISNYIDIKEDFISLQQTLLEPPTPTTKQDKFKKRPKV